MFRILYFMLLLLVVDISCTAQNQWLNGYLQDSLTLFPVTDGYVVNGKTNIKAATDRNGFFRLEAKPGDPLYVSAKTYYGDTIQYSYLFTDTIRIVLSLSGNILPNVIVRSNYTKYQLDSIERKADFEDAIGQKMSTFSSSHPSGFGLTFSLDKLFKSKYKGRREKEKRFAVSEKAAYIDYRFSPHLVAHFTGYKGEVLRDFMNRYTPNYEWLRDHATNEDLLYYINDKIKIYKTERLVPYKG